jgi:hypothetical protein
LTPVSGTLRQLGPLKIHEISRNASERQRVAALPSSTISLHAALSAEHQSRLPTQPAGSLAAIRSAGMEMPGPDEFIASGQAARLNVQ